MHSIANLLLSCWFRVVSFWESCFLYLHWLMQLSQSKF